MKDEMFDFKRNSLLGNISGQPLCADYKAALRKCGNNKELLVRLALMQQSVPYLSHACYKGMGLTKEYIKEEFKDYINGYVVNDADNVNGYTYGLYVDWDYENDLEIKTDVASLMWCVGTNVVLSKCACPTLYVSNRSNIHLICEGFNTVFVKLFDKSVVTIQDCDETCDIIVYSYSKDAKVNKGDNCIGNVKVFEKELRL